MVAVFLKWDHHEQLHGCRILSALPHVTLKQ